MLLMNSGIGLLSENSQQQSLFLCAFWFRASTARRGFLQTGLLSECWSEREQQQTNVLLAVPQCIGIGDGIVLLDGQKIRIKNKVCAWETLHLLDGWCEPPAISTGDCLGAFPRRLGVKGRWRHLNADVTYYTFNPYDIVVLNFNRMNMDRYKGLGRSWSTAKPSATEGVGEQMPHARVSSKYGYILCSILYCNRHNKLKPRASECISLLKSLPALHADEKMNHFMDPFPLHCISPAVPISD